MRTTEMDARAWQADTLDPPASWYFRLEPALLDLLNPVVQQGRGMPTTSVRLPADRAAAAADMLEGAVQILEAGRGFVILDRLPLDRYAPADAQAIYWLIGQALGQPIAQNVQGTLLYDVRDTGQDVRYGARFSVTSAESTFHTDNSFGAEVLDYVGLLCLNSARAGGLSQVVSGYRVVEELRASQPGMLDILGQPFHFDRRGGLRDGEAPTSRSPILSWEGRGLTVRYLRYWIETGHEKAGEPLMQDQVEAMNALDDVLARRELRAEFALEPGQMFFINNRWVLHNRTAFEDNTEPARRRHLVRLWVRAQARGQTGRAG